MKLITSTQEIDVSEYGLRCLKYHISSPELSHDTDKIDGLDGAVLLESTYNSRTILVEMFAKSEDLADMYLLQSEFYRLFAKKELFYIVFDREPFKSWQVILNKPFEVEKINTRNGKFDLEFIAFSPLAESILLEYKYTSNFSFNNIGDVAIDMRERIATEVEFKGVSDNLVIRNVTTGDEWNYTGTTTETDVILLKGVRSTKNDISIFKDTNKGILTINTGWNNIEVEGSTNFTITLSTRFYYL